MDYEKAYKAVLQTATQWIKDGCTDKEKICLECVFPELRESEDERIRKWLVDYFSSIKETVWIHRDITCEQILAFLEKQKENPKNADSIPEDCASLAKCEERNSKYGVFPEDVIVVARACEKLEAHGYPELAHALKNVNLYTKEQKPVECIEDSVKFEEGFKVGRESGLRDGQKYVLNNLDSYGLCKPAEWSEEDEQYLLVCKNALSKYQRSDQWDANIISNWLERRLKSLRPQPHWKPSEDEERLINTSISFLKDFADKGYENAVECIDWLKSKLNGNSGK